MNTHIRVQVRSGPDSREELDKRATAGSSCQPLSSESSCLRSAGFAENGARPHAAQNATKHPGGALRRKFARGRSSVFAPARVGLELLPQERTSCGARGFGCDSPGRLDQDWSTWSRHRLTCLGIRHGAPPLELIVPHRGNGAIRTAPGICTEDRVWKSLIAVSRRVVCSASLVSSSARRTSNCSRAALFDVSLIHISEPTRRTPSRTVAT